MFAYSPTNASTKFDPAERGGNSAGGVHIVRGLRGRSSVKPSFVYAHDERAGGRIEHRHVEIGCDLRQQDAPAANVACPQSGTSVSGVNQRS